jgi:hypothetical protein
MQAIHAGMTEFSSVGERKLMKHFVLASPFMV